MAEALDQVMQRHLFAGVKRIGARRVLCPGGIEMDSVRFRIMYSGHNFRVDGRITRDAWKAFAALAPRYGDAVNIPGHVDVTAKWTVDDIAK